MTPADATTTMSHLMRARMFDQRVVVVNGELDDVVASRAAAELMMLDASGDEPVRLLLNCGGGTYAAAFTLIDVIDLLGVPVHALCIGRAEGVALGVLAVAARREAVPHARLRMCEPGEAFTGATADVERRAAQHDADVRRFRARLAEATRRPERWITDVLQEGRYLDVHEAIRAGVIDDVARSSAASVQAIAGRPI
ncbi:MAG: ATP-dependent Clp protease proteolytic subunit, partial [Acidobacteriota bacterium]